jgi:hypothetical protein
MSQNVERQSIRPQCLPDEAAISRDAHRLALNTGRRQHDLGALLVFIRTCSKGHFLGEVERHRCSVLFSTPRIIQDLCQRRHVIVGNAPPCHDMIRAGNHRIDVGIPRRGIDANRDGPASDAEKHVRVAFGHAHHFICGNSRAANTRVRGNSIDPFQGN